MMVRELAAVVLGEQFISPLGFATPVVVVPCHAARGGQHSRVCVLTIMMNKIQQVQLECTASTLDACILASYKSTHAVSRTYCAPGLVS